MAFTETYHCDVCGNPKGEAEDWWLALTEPASLIPSAPEQPMLRLTQWNILLSHAAKVRHLCGARCAQTLMDRWMRGEKRGFPPSGKPPTLRLVAPDRSKQVPLPPTVDLLARIVW